MKIQDATFHQFEILEPQKKEKKRPIQQDDHQRWTCKIVTISTLIIQGLSKLKDYMRVYFIMLLRVLRYNDIFIAFLPVFVFKPHDLVQIDKGEQNCESPFKNKINL